MTDTPTPSNEKGLGYDGWLVIAVSFALVWIALSRTTPHTSDHV